MRVLVFGGRHFNDREALYTLLDHLHNIGQPITWLIHGGARGADQLGESWAMSRGVQTQCFLPQWNKYGAGAGPRRNERMLLEGRPVLGVACPGGPGTADMTARCKRVGVPVLTSKEDVDEWEAKKGSIRIRATGCDCPPGQCAAGVCQDDQCINRRVNAVTQHCPVCHPSGTGATWHENGKCLRCEGRELGLVE